MECDSMALHIYYGSGHMRFKEDTLLNTICYQESFQNDPITFKSEDYKKLSRLLCTTFNAHEIIRKGSVFTNWEICYLIQGGIVKNDTPSGKSDCGIITILHEKIDGLVHLLDTLELPYRKEDLEHKAVPA